MIEQYRSELNKISGDQLWKEKLKQSMQRKKEKRTLSFCALAFSMCLLLIMSQINQQLPLLIINEEIENTEFGGLGDVGNLGTDSSLLDHNVPYNCYQNEKILPVYENTTAEDEAYLYKIDSDELLEILIQGAEKIGYEGYEVEYLKADPYLINSPVYLISDFGKLDLFKRDQMQLRINEECHLLIGGNTQQEKLKSVQKLIEKHGNLFPFEDPYIDVYLISNYESQKWRIRICETGHTQEETLVNHQLNYAEIYENEKGEVESVIYQMTDLSKLTGNYPIKSCDEAGKLLHADYEYAEMIYEPVGIYYIPYYRFYIRNDQDIIETRNICAVEDQYIKFEGQN